MKNRFIYIVLVIFAIITLFLLITIKCSREREKNKNKFVFPTTMVAVNASSLGYVDTLCMVVLNKIMNYDTMTIVIVAMPEVTYNDMDLVAFVQKYSSNPHSYYLHINGKAARSNLIETIAHEMVHINQMETGRLITFPGANYVIFMGERVDLLTVPYNQRLYEIQAFILGHEYAKQLNHLVYDHK